MKINKNFYTLAAALLICVFMLTACGNNSNIKDLSEYNSYAKNYVSEVGGSAEAVSYNSLSAQAMNLSDYNFLIECELKSDYESLFSLIKVDGTNFGKKP